MALHVDTEHLMGFGMNLGYNSLTAGARTIRRLESECGYDIPWCLTLAIDRKGYTAHESDYTSLIEQGKRLGIYTYLIIAPELPVGLFTLLHQQKDCAFLLFTSPDELTGDVIDTMAQLYHVMPVVRFGDGAEEICDAMRRREMLYSVFLPYHSEKSENISSDGDVLDIEQFHAPLTIFMSYTASEKGQSSPFYRRIIAARNDLHTQTIPVELWEDLRYVDGALSPRASYSVVFDERCRLIRPDGTVDDSISFPPLRWKASLPPCNKISPGSAGIPQDRDSFYHFVLGSQLSHFYPLYRGINADLQHPHKFLRRYTIFIGKPPHKRRNKGIRIKIDAELLVFRFLQRGRQKYLIEGSSTSLKCSRKEFCPSMRSARR